MTSRHRWDNDAVKRLAANEASDGNGRTERACLYCGLFKITVHPPQGLPWRVWRRGDEEWTDPATPSCVARPEAVRAPEPASAKVIAV